MGGEINVRWTFEEAVHALSARYYPGGMTTGGKRNSLIEAWGQLVGRSRALGGMDAAVSRYGSPTAAARALRMSRRTWRALHELYSSLPDDAPVRKIGRWHLQSKLGRGGNGEVWRAADFSGVEGAVKILRRLRGGGYERFRDEIAILRELAGTPGVMPVVDYALPDKPTEREPPFLVMPLAIPLRDHLSGELDGVVAAFAAISATLADLASRGISHRDLKPENLFWLNARPVVGDFGLADFPGKEALTRGGNKLGPVFYIAPEMLNTPDTADGNAADVYSLAKTLWVFATGQNYPLPGEQRVSVEATRLSTYVKHERAGLLDTLIERCCRLMPAERPMMQTVARELRGWLPPAASAGPLAFVNDG